MANSSFHHICIQTNRYKQSLDFYTKLLGFTLALEHPNFHGRAYNSWLQLGDFYIELQTGKGNEVLSEPSKEVQGMVHFCLWVENIEEIVTELKEKGVKFKRKNGKEIYDVEGGRLSKVYAPEGTLIELRENKGI